MNIEECIVTSFFVLEPFLDIEYEVNDAAIRSTIPPFAIEPACQYVVDYEVGLVLG